MKYRSPTHVSDHFKMQPSLVEMIDELSKAKHRQSVYITALNVVLVMQDTTQLNSEKNNHIGMQ